MIKNNLLNFPTVYTPSIGNLDRINFMSDQGRKYDIDIKVFPVKSVMFNREEFKINGKYAGSNKQEDLAAQYGLWAKYATFVSYIQCMKHWLENSNEEFLIVCDDDTDFSSNEYWNFSWEYFLSLLPTKWQCLQLIRMRGEIDVKYSEIPKEQIIQNHLGIIKDLNDGHFTNETLHFKIVPRNMFHAHVGGGAFLLKREYVNRLVKKFIRDGEFDIDVQTPKKYSHLINDTIVPLYNESYIVSLAEDDESYNVPLFVENVDFYSSYHNLHSKPFKRGPLWEYIKYNSSIYYKIFWEHVFEHTNIESMTHNPLNIGYQIVSPNELGTTFSDNLRKEMETRNEKIVIR
jgi:hypothetical protein